MDFLTLRGSGSLPAKFCFADLAESRAIFRNEINVMCLIDGISAVFAAHSVLIVIHTCVLKRMKGLAAASTNAVVTNVMPQRGKMLRRYAITADTALIAGASAWAHTIRCPSDKPVNIEPVRFRYCHATFAAHHFMLILIQQGTGAHQMEVNGL